MVWMVLIQTVGMDQRAELVFFSCVYQWSYGLARLARLLQWISFHGVIRICMDCGWAMAVLFSCLFSGQRTQLLFFDLVDHGMEREMRPMNECMRGRALCGRHARGNRTNDKKKEQEHSHVCNGDSYPLSSMTAVAT
jgi:hypothetical protein